MSTAYFFILSRPDRMILQSPLWLKITLHTVQISGMIFGMLSLCVLRSGEFFGIRQALRCMRDKAVDLSPYSLDGTSAFTLCRSGVYAIVRHPIYLAGIIMITFQPEVTINRLFVTVLADLYFIGAAYKEEFLLLRNPQSGYREYRQEVPMFNIVAGVSRRLRTKADPAERSLAVSAQS